METQKPSVVKNAMTYGLYLGVVSIVFTLIIYLAGLLGNKAIGWLSVAISIGVLAWAMINFRDKQNGGYLRYGQGVGLGTLTMFFGGVISGVFTFILYKFIDPGIVEQLVAQAMEEAMAQGTPDAQLEMAEKMIRMFTSPNAILIMSIVGSPFMGAIISLILAAIFKKEPQMFDGSQIEEA
ncbi:MULTISPECIES: DUF4199 domain-containing protein [unclassified Carboxylicivirga]|uniref:DUF4199 domain-containing protein n=1 Tax=Carboxylicivirga TaxID=1628153 RepID=UPI003D32A588